jgi:hypothetical protein
MAKSARTRPPPRRPAPRPAPATSGQTSWVHFRKVLRAAQFFVSDTVIAGVIITCIWGLSLWFHALWGQADHLLFDRLPLRYLFDAVDVGVIGMFGWRAVCSAAVVFKE